MEDQEGKQAAAGTSFQCVFRSQADRLLDLQLIKALEEARGNGTSMISLIMPPKDQVSTALDICSECYVCSECCTGTILLKTMYIFWKFTMTSLMLQVARVQKMLGDEFGTASNIKSRVNRQSVLGAITSAQQRLKLYNKVFFLPSPHTPPT